MPDFSRLSTPGSRLTVGGVVLCGGRSTRMGRPKAWLPFGDETMLQRVVRTLREVVWPMVIVAAPDQELPPLPSDMRIVRDEQEGLGPLAGLAGGLRSLDQVADAAYVSSCDVPLLRPQFVRAVVGRLEEFDLAIPHAEGYHHPLAAVYRTALGEQCARLLSEGRRRPLDLVRASRSVEIDVEELRAADPDLVSLRNANTPEEYAALLTLAGVDAPPSLPRVQHIDFHA